MERNDQIIKKREIESNYTGVISFETVLFFFMTVNISYNHVLTWFIDAFCPKEFVNSTIEVIGAETVFKLEIVFHQRLDAQVTVWWILHLAGVTWVLQTYNTPDINLNITLPQMLLM